MTTTLLRNGQIVDGTGSVAFKGHVLIDGDRIEAVIPEGQEPQCTRLPQRDEVLFQKRSLLPWVGPESPFVVEFIAPVGGVGKGRYEGAVRRPGNGAADVVEVEVRQEDVGDVFGAEVEGG